MGAPMSAGAFLEALRAEGVTVVQVGDWRTHNRNGKGSWGPVNGVMIHHTVTRGTARTVDICRDGYVGLPGPLCHGVIAKDGRVYLVGYGRANHAGLGDDDVLRAVIAEEPLPTDNETNTDGNSRFYGFECENLGDGKDPWPPVQLEAIERVSAALCRHHGWSARSVIGHREWQPGKVDPRGFSMTSMRARIHDRLISGEQQEPTIPPIVTPAPAPAPAPVEDPMDYTSLARTSPVTVAAGATAVVAWDAEYQDGAGDHAPGSAVVLSGNHYSGTASVAAAAPVPAGVSVRLVQAYVGGTSGEPATELTAGARSHSVSVTGRVPGGRSLRLEVANGSSQEVTLTWAALRLLTWAL